jgi:hypothetical protein
MSNLHQCRFAGATAVISDNTGLVSAVARTAAGDYTLTTARELADNEWAVRPIVEHNAVFGGANVERLTATSYRIRVGNAAGALGDPLSLRVIFERTRYVQA